MSKAVQLAAYGGVDRLEIVEVAKPEPEAGEVLVRVVAAGINPGEISIREGLLADMYPMDFPFGEGSDFAGVVEALGAGVAGFAQGDEVVGWVDTRSSHAEYVVADAKNLVAKPIALDWFRAGSLFIAGTTAIATVRAVDLKAGDVVVISGAAGGVGSIAVQLAVREGARVIGIASDARAKFLTSVGAEHVAYGDDLAKRLRALVPDGVDAWIDLFGDGYVAIAIELGVEPGRIDTIIDFAAVERYGVESDGSAAAASAESLGYLAHLVAWGEIVWPIAAIYPFAAVREAFVKLAERKAHGKIVLAMDPKIAKPISPE